MGSERLKRSRWGAAADSLIRNWVWQQQAVRTSPKTMRAVQWLPESWGNLHCDHWRGQTVAAESYLSPATRCTTTLWGRRGVTAETEEVGGGVGEGCAEVLRGSPRGGQVPLTVGSRTEKLHERMLFCLGKQVSPLKWSDSWQRPKP